MATSITSRVGSSPASDVTKRVASSGASAGLGPFIGGDTWGGTWGGSWGFTWHYGTLETGGSEASPAVDVTTRVGEAPASSITKRVSL